MATGSIRSTSCTGSSRTAADILMGAGAGVFVKSYSSTPGVEVASESLASGEPSNKNADGDGPDATAGIGDGDATAGVCDATAGVGESLNPKPGEVGNGLPVTRA